MVFFFTICDATYVVYMGKDKFENEQLIEFGLPCDVWFHVDNLSSAHVYLRLKDGQTIDSIPDDVLTDLAQLVKANSIEGCKTANINVVYTMHDNLRKTGNMAVGQVGFKDEKAVKKLHVPKKIVEIVKRLEKSKVEKEHDFRAEREDYLADRLRKDKAERKKTADAEKAAQKEKLEAEKLLRYDDVMKEKNMTSNKEVAGAGKTVQEIEDDFM